MDIKFIDTSDWQELAWFSSGGTRAKKILQSPSGEEFYFKCSEKKPAKDGKAEKHYKYEFWNEIIAYQLGKSLGLNVLRYDVAIYNNEIGCLSPKMTISGEEQLIEIGRFMTSMDSDFLPEDNQNRKRYTFQLLSKTLEHFNLVSYWAPLFQTLIFDAILGNTDRHQENWAFIGNTINIETTQNCPGKIINANVTKIAPIYDSGSSLARELTDERINILIHENHEKELVNYIDKGKSELHWNGEKISHYELFKQLLNTPYREVVKESARFLDNWNNSFITNMIESSTDIIPENWQEYSIPHNRKTLILKVLNLRFDKLYRILND